MPPSNWPIGHTPGSIAFPWRTANDVPCSQFAVIGYTMKAIVAVGRSVKLGWVIGRPASREPAAGNAGAQFADPGRSGNQVQRRYDNGVLQALQFISCQPKSLMAAVIAAYASLANSS
jgi:hypothetical protein